MDDRFRFKKIACPVRYNNPEPNLFAGTDTRELFETNLRKMPANWNYRTKEVTYRRDSLGYRSKEISEIDPSNFFVVYGCSFTEGVGLAEDETWYHTLANDLEMDYLNYGLGGTGAECIHLNSISFVNNSPYKPKFVVLQWPAVGRQMWKNLNIWLDMIPQNIEHRKQNFIEAYMQFQNSVKTQSYLFDNYISFMSTQAIWKAAGVPVYNWSMNSEWNQFMESDNQIDTYYPTDIERQPENLARDVAHFGPQYHIRSAHGMAWKIANNPIFGLAHKNLIKFGFKSVDNL
jgi:hypothetical protein